MESVPIKKVRNMSKKANDRDELEQKAIACCPAEIHFVLANSIEETPDADLQRLIEMHFPTTEPGYKAGNAHIGLLAFKQRTGTDELDLLVRDFLTSLMHFCFVNQIDFDIEIRRARQHYLEENPSALDA